MAVLGHRHPRLHGAALAELRGADGTVLARLELFPAVSENPTLSFDVRGNAPTEVWLRDNNGNEFKAEL